MTRKPSRYRSNYDPRHPYGLTGAEWQIINEMAKKGERQLELAARLRFSRGAINSHLWNIYAKMDVHTSAEACVKWIREQEMPPRL